MSVVWTTTAKRCDGSSDAAANAGSFYADDHQPSVNVGAVAAPRLVSRTNPSMELNAPTGYVSQSDCASVLLLKLIR